MLRSVTRIPTALLSLSPLYQIRFGVDRVFDNPAMISQFETGRREPPLMLLLAYAKLAGISTDDLIDDRINL